MAFKKEEEKKRLYFSPIKNRLSESELVTLDEELKQYRKVVLANQWFPEESSHVNQTKWMIARGAKDKNGAIILSNYTPAKYGYDGRCVSLADCDPILFEQLEEDFEQWNQWKGRKEFGEKKKLESYENIF